MGATGHLRLQRGNPQAFQVPRVNHTYVSDFLSPPPWLMMFPRIDKKMFDDSMQVNVNGAFYACQSAARQMVK